MQQGEDPQWAVRGDQVEIGDAASEQGLARRSTIATSTPANASSPANISPVGPPPAITTACSVIATLLFLPVLA